MPVQTRTKPELFDVAGHPLHLGSELGSGGEGGVYELRDRLDVVVKLYRKPLDPEKSAKITTMAKFANDRLLKLTAWPTEPVVSGTGAVVGFTMAKITGHKLAFRLSSPKLRLQEFPTASWQFLIHSAANTARAFSAVHDLGHVIGDVKQENLFIGEKATVCLIDCDSYQITINGSRWFCEVGTPTHQPPELQNIRTYKGVVRTPNHDNFGLAVIIFQMLFMGRHPFSGRFLGTGEMPMERAISECRFAYSSNAAATQMLPALSSVGLNGVTRDVALLFERAFSRQGSQPNGRPSPAEWVRALQDLEQRLKKCAVNPAHHFVGTLSKCPWCEIEAASGVPLFQVGVVGLAQTGFAIAVFWAKVLAVPNPGSPPALPRIEAQTVTLSPVAVELQQAAWGAKIASGLLAFIGLPGRIHSMKKDLEKKAADARSRWSNLQNNWNSHTDGKGFHDLLSDVQNLREQYDRLPQKRLQALQTLEANRYRLQLQAHLDRCRISHARIRGIGDARKATLQSYGIETAADIVDHRVLAVPGFGPVALNHLKQWRNLQQRRFVFDPNRGVDQAAKNTVERQILTEKIDLERKLNEGLSKLTVSSHHILTRRSTLVAQAEQAANDLAQAEADLRASSAISPIVPGKRAIVALGAISIGGLIIASQLGKGPSAVTPQHMPQQVQPQQTQPSAAFPAPPLRPTLSPHVERDATGQLRPEDGYDWSDGGRGSVRWTPGELSRQHPHVIASDTEGEWQPDDGYNWVDPAKPKDKSVRWIPGIASTRYPNVVAATVEGQWRPADGYTWEVYPPRSGDLKVRPITGLQDQYTNPLPAPPFDHGLADRAEWEQWLSTLSGDFRRGAEWWAGHRSLSSPGACNGPAAAMNQQFIFGCEEAKVRLGPKDIKRKSDPDYRRGWNSYADTSTPPPATGGQAPIVDQGASAASPDTDADAAKRLNEQELKRLRNHQ
jgi:DNA-binding helix-hairpin-helix protein with protein kinase domain